MRSVLLVVLLLAACEAPAVEADGDIAVDYVKVKSSLRPMERTLRESRVLERAAEHVERVVALPSDVEVLVTSCKDGTGYEPDYDVVELCLEDLVTAREAVRDAGEEDVKGTVLGIAQATLLHELGHAVIDVRDLPVTGREEDAADQFAVWQALVGLDAPDIVLSDAFAYELDSEIYEHSADDEHGSDDQRAINLYCWLYGSSPKEWKHLVDGEPLTKYRAKQCADEWDALVYAWETLLETHPESAEN
jgi:hypothetical protein